MQFSLIVLGHLMVSGMVVEVPAAATDARKDFCGCTFESDFVKQLECMENKITTNACPSYGLYDSITYTSVEDVLHDSTALLLPYGTLSNALCLFELKVPVTTNKPTLYSIAIGNFNGSAFAEVEKIDLDGDKVATSIANGVVMVYFLKDTYCGQGNYLRVDFEDANILDAKNMLKTNIKKDVKGSKLYHADSVAAKMNLWSTAGAVVALAMAALH